MATRVDAALGCRSTLALLWACATVVVALLVNRYWIPLDDGTLAQSAERVFLGELPHRDFGDPYTGLNAMLGAAAFRFFGVGLASLRIPLVAGFALWLPAVWLLARRHLPPGAALLAASAAAATSVLAYPAAMPTWFTLFVITWGAWMLCRVLDGGHRVWLAGAGALAGLAVLFKVVGLYFVAAALLALARRRADGTRIYAGVTAVGTLAFLALLGALVLRGRGLANAYQFFLPAVGIVALLVADTRAAGGGRGAPSETAAAMDDGRLAGGLGPLATDGVLLTLGFLAPLGLFLVPYAASGSVGAWMEGVFLMPARRWAYASSPPGPAWTVVPGIAAVVLAAVAARLSHRAERRLTLALAVLLAVALAADDALDGAVIEALWYAVRGWMPALVAAVAVAAWLPGRVPGVTGDTGPSAAGPVPRSVATFALLATAGLWGLVQFPWASPAYFFYTAPLVVLATAAATTTAVVRRGPVMAFLTAIYLFLGVGYVAGVASSGTTELGGPRGGIRVPESDASRYGELALLVRSRAAGGGVWAGPDAPEVYFLSGVRNPTPTLYEFLDRVPMTPDGLATLLDSRDVRVAVLNTRPLFSQPLDPRILEHLVREFPRSRTLGPYVVRWREP